MNISEKAALYADGKARKTSASIIKAIAQAYEDGYKDGYKERQTGAPLNSGGSGNCRFRSVERNTMDNRFRNRRQRKHHLSTIKNRPTR